MTTVKHSARTIVFRIGLILLAVGVGPLFLTIVFWLLHFNVTDNPIGFGLLFITLTPIALILLVIGALLPKERVQDIPNVPVGEVHQIPLNPTEKPELSAEQQAYVDANCWGGCWGLMYYLYMGVPSAYFIHLPANFIYTNVVAHARRQVWDRPEWTDFDEFKRRNQVADRSAATILAICAILFVLLIFL